ncbi:MAG TPA: transposase [Burkholderiales bacterium]|nr:transposase [Burkholderiales bacterium]
MMVIKKIKGIKRFILVDSLGIILHNRVEPANTSEKTGARLNKLTTIFADGGYLSGKLSNQIKNYGFDLTIVKRNCKSFKVLPKRWIVERTFGWFNRFRRLSKNYESRVQMSD